MGESCMAGGDVGGWVSHGRLVGQAGLRVVPQVSTWSQHYFLFLVYQLWNTLRDARKKRMDAGLKDADIGEIDEHEAPAARIRRRSSMTQLSINHDDVSSARARFFFSPLPFFPPLLPPPPPPGGEWPCHFPAPYHPHTRRMICPFAHAHRMLAGAKSDVTPDSTPMLHAVRTEISRCPTRTWSKRGTRPGTSRSTHSA